MQRKNCLGMEIKIEIIILLTPQIDNDIGLTNLIHIRLMRCVGQGFRIFRAHTSNERDKCLLLSFLVRDFVRF